MSEVSNRIMVSHLVHIKSRGLDTRENLYFLLDGLDVEGLERPEYWEKMSHRGRVSWRDYAIFVRRIGQIFPQEINWPQDFAEEAFNNSENFPFLSFILQICSYAISAPQIFEIMKRYGGPKLFEGLIVTFNRQTGKLWELTMEVPQPQELIFEFYEINKFAFEMYPALLGFPKVPVEYQLVGRKAHYLLDMSKHDSYFGRFVRLIKSYYRYPKLLDFLDEQGESERRSYVKLWASQRELEKMHAELEERIQQRTQDLKETNEKLQDEINERRRVEESLKRSERRYRHIVENSHSGIWELDRNGCTVFANPSLCNMLGYTLEEMVGRYGPEFLEEEAQESGHMRIANRRAGIAEKFTLPFRHKTGRKVLLHIDSVPIPDGDGYIGSSAIVRDVTAEVEAEENAIEREAQKRQLQKLEALGTLAGGVAHDFNNILQGIYSSLGLVDQLLEEGHTAKERIAVAQNFAEKGSKLVEQILTFSRRERSEREPIDLVKMIEEALPFLKESYGEILDIEFSTTLDRAPVLGNYGELTQVLINLCSNSAYACVTRGRLGILLEKGEEETHFRLTVTDTGPGISRNIQDRVFEPFFSTKPVGSGTGMGLSLSHGIIKRHEGRLMIDKEYSYGARFLLDLPAQENLVVEERSEENRIQMGQGERLLVVEDEPVILDLLRAQLDDIGYKVTTAKNGVEALLTFEQNPEDYDVILSDINMPDMGGDVMAQCLQRGGWDVPLILFTGQRVPDNLKRLEGTKVVDLLTKPIGVVPLSHVLRKAITKKKTRNYQS